MAADAEEHASVCTNCGLPDRSQSTKVESPSGIAGKSTEGPDTKRPVRRRRKRPPVPDRSRERGTGLMGYAISTALLLVVWGALAGLSLVTKTAACWLVVCAMLTTIIGAGWLYRSAFADGVERVNFFSISSPNLFVRLFLLADGLIFIPIFSVVYLFMFFENAWKPFRIEILGIAMCAAGAVLVLR